MTSQTKGMSVYCTHYPMHTTLPVSTIETSHRDFHNKLFDCSQVLKRQVSLSSACRWGQMSRKLPLVETLWHWYEGISQCTDRVFHMGIRTCSHFHFISACFHTASISNFQFNYRVNQ